MLYNNLPQTRSQCSTEDLVHFTLSKKIFFLIAFAITFNVNSQSFTGNELKNGPIAQKNKSVIFLAADLKNGGITSVYRSFEKAAKLLGWKITIKNGMGKTSEQSRIFEEAISGKPDGIILGGLQSTAFKKEIQTAKEKNIALVGWHASEKAGPTKDLFANITTDPREVAKITAEFVIKDAIINKANLGIILFNDSQFAIANKKIKTIIDFIEACKGYKNCKVLSVENIPISEADKTIPTIVPKLIEKYGNHWTYSIGINDIYFDTINLPLLQAGRRDIRNVSAGDGSLTALSRISNGKSQQIGTIAEPLKLQGFQLADELNRAFANHKPSEFISKPILVTTELLQEKSGLDVETDIEEIYTSIWFK